ncbi:MAG: hypothetical protein ABI811_09665 [Acidobacteriota bacterium]
MRFLKTFLTYSVGLSILAYYVATSGPSASWKAFFADDASNFTKTLFLLQTYSWPLVQSFVAMLCMQAPQRLKSPGVIFSFSMAGWAMLLNVIMHLDSLSRPAYIVGIASALTLASQVYAVTLPNWKFGIRVPRFVFKWQHDRIAALHACMVAQRVANSQA